MRAAHQLLWFHLLGVALCFACVQSVWASPPNDMKICTKSPASRWMKESLVRAQIDMKEVALIKFKLSSTNCYEYYGVRNNGSIFESYYDPLTGGLIKHTVIATDTGLTMTQTKGTPIHENQ
ncbi:MAG: hypothetical protein RLZZ502_1698 [Pseudomonadota bacterium]|jgi:hypothetical protein